MDKIKLEKDIQEIELKLINSHKDDLLLILGQ